MTATPILETLAHEFSSSVEHVRNALEMIDAGLSAPFIARFRRAHVGTLPEGAIRRLEYVRQELEELDRRRGTILRLLEREQGLPEAALHAIRSCMDRFELEDLFVPHRRPEPEVQLALDRGLGALADLLVAPVPKSERAEASAEPESEEEETDDPPVTSAEPAADAADALASADVPASADSPAFADVPASADAAASAEALEHSDASAPQPDAPAPADETHAPAQDSGDDGFAAPPAKPHAHVDVRTLMSVHLARTCAPFVNPDRGIHTESEALAGALRILSDRLGRDAELRGAVRRQLRKHGVLTVRATVDEGKAGRWRSLLKIRQPLRQIQGHRLLAIRQAQKERVLATHISLDPAKILPRVRAALGRHTHPAHASVLEEVAGQALNDRLLPMAEQDIRLELKERADGEALRFLSQHLRQILLAPFLGQRPVIGVDVSARGDWTLAYVDARGVPRPAAEGRSDRIEVGEKDAAALGAEIAAWLGSSRAEAVAVGHGKGPRAAVGKLRAAVAAAGVDAFVFIVNEAGLSSAANSESARQELPGFPVPQRCAIGIARRLQDPLAEILKVDPRHLGLGSEVGLVSKANVRRVFDETIAMAVAFVGADIHRSPLAVLERIPGLDRESAKRIVARRAEKPFASREEVRQEGILDEARWTSAIAFLRVPGSTDPLDGTGLHPELYPLVRKILEGAGTSVEEGLGRMGSTRGLRRVDFGLDDATWRDLMREIAHPGRDPRQRLLVPRILDPGADAATVTKDRVVEGIVSNVASFGAFVDVGLPQDAMIHISEISDHYVRDAREFLAIGQVVHARILDPTGQRLSLSLKNVPRFERVREQPARPRRGARPVREVEKPAVVRAAQSRRDGLGSFGGGRDGGRRERGDRGRGGPGRRRDGGGGGGRGRGDDVGRPGDVPKTDKAPGFSPFASFFRARQAEGEPDERPREEQTG